MGPRERMMTDNMSELIRFLTLSGALFSVGLYGLFVRRSPFAALLSLGVMLCALTLSAWSFNHFVRPVDMNGYLIGGLLALLALVYAYLARPLFDRNRSVDETAEVRLDGISADPNKVSREDIISVADLPLSVSLALVFVVGYLLLRVSVAGFLAFFIGVLALKYIMYRRTQKHLGQLSTMPLQPASAKLAGFGHRKTGSAGENPISIDQG